MIELGPFGLDSPIGKGGMGQVWSGIHRRLKYPVAVKFLTAKGHRRPQFLAAFRNEVRSVAGLDHRNIVRVFDHGEVGERAEPISELITPGTPWLAMELVVGGTLTGSCGRLPWPSVEGVILALLDALGHAHARGVIHRDLKPSNILVTGDPRAPRVKLTDFGLAEIAESRDGTDTQRVGGGTPAYMAPEQFESRWRDYGPWTDLYAAGCLFHALVRGTPPFGHHRSAEEQRHDHLHSRPPPLRATFALPEGFERWLGRLLEKEPERRFRRAADVIQALRALGPLIPPSEEPGRPPEAITLPPFPDGALDSESRVLPPLITGPPPVPQDWRPNEGELAAVEAPLTGLGLFGLRAVPFVGRIDERNRLWDALHRTADTRSVHGVVLSGPEGSGKSRLAEWLAQRAHEVGAAQMLRANHSQVPGPTHGLGPMLRIALRCQGLERPAALRRIEGIVRSRGVTHADEWEALTEIVHPAEPGTPGAIRFGSPTERYVTVRRTLQALAAERPIVLVLDDAHHGLDALRFAMYLLDYPTRQPLPVLVVLTVTDELLATRRDEATLVAELLEHDRAVRIEVPPLPPANRPALVRAILGLEPSLAARVEDRTAGNPLFAVQLIGDWVLRGAIEPAPEGFRLRLDEELPADAHAMWAGRVERVLADRTAEHAHALEIAAVLGVDVDPQEWRTACQRAEGPAPADALVDALLDLRLARCGPAGPTEGWSFAHRALRESVVSRARRGGRLARWHRVCAEVLSMPEDPHPPEERIGRHWLGADEPARAVGPLRAGAIARIANGDYAVAEELLDLQESAFELLQIPNSDPRWGECWLLRHEIASNQGRYDDTERWLEQIDGAATLFGWDRIRNQVRCLRGRRDRIRGLYTSALTWLADVEQDAARRGDRQLMAESRLEIGRALLGSADVPGATKWIRLAQQEYQAIGDPLGTAESWMALGEVAKEADQHAEATNLLRRAEALFEQGGHRWRMAAAINTQGDVARSLGDLDLAAGLYRRARGLLKAIGSRAWVYPEYNTGLVYLARGDQKRAQGMLEVAMAVFTEQGNSAALANAHLALALCSALDEQWILWDDHLREAIGLLHQTGFSDEDTARLATQAGAAAARDEQVPRARDAYVLAAQLWTALDRKREVTQVERALAGLEPSS